MAHRRRVLILMGMTITIELADATATEEHIDAVIAYLRHVDEVFSTYKPLSEISRINRGEVAPEAYSREMRDIFARAEQTKHETEGYFDIVKPDGTRDPSGIVKGWAIFEAAELLGRAGLSNFFIDAGGDIEVRGRQADGSLWTVGIRHPWKPETDVIKVLALTDRGVATSGTYARGAHIYNPLTKKAIEGTADGEILSLTVIGPNVYEADRFATAAFAMGISGVQYIEALEEFEAYAVDTRGVATMTTNFSKYV